jgi:hypothetical protein
LGVCATLVRRRYPEVNALIRKIRKAEKTFVDIIYGKQNLTEAAPPLPAQQRRRSRKAAGGASTCRTIDRLAAAGYPRGCQSGMTLLQIVVALSV